ncbi:MAG: hypothetical protein H7Y42_04725 [Chitinophagaceae bacterium]|nr:hypothetical protein [Chitinophagaceae bacterium]
MKKSFGIASVESKAVFHEEAFEDFINNAMPARIYMANESDQFSSNYKNIDWCGAYTPFNGSVDILCRSNRKGELKRLSIPSNTLFLVICTKEYGGNYKVAWTCSMS